MPQLPPCFSNTSRAPKKFVFLSASQVKVKKFQLSLGMLVVHPEAMAVTSASGHQQLASHSPFPEPHCSLPEPDSFHQALANLPVQRRHSSFLCPSWRQKSWTLFRMTKKILMYCTIVMWRAWFYVLGVKSFKAFSVEPSLISTRKTVSATCQVQLSMLVKEALHYDIPFPRYQNLQTDRHTHTHTPNGCTIQMQHKPDRNTTRTLSAFNGNGTRAFHKPLLEDWQ